MKLKMLRRVQSVLLAVMLLLFLTGCLTGEDGWQMAAGGVAFWREFSGLSGADVRIAAR